MPKRAIKSRGQVIGAKPGINTANYFTFLRLMSSFIKWGLKNYLTLKDVVKVK